MLRNLRLGHRALSTAAFPAPLHFRASGGRVSAWHDIPLVEASAAAGVYNFVCEIPRGARAKMEISTDDAHNPIIQDKTKAGAPRSYGLDSLVNYGALPQTYEDPAHKDTWTGLLGDGDPIDVCDISSTPRPTGSVYSVKVIGALAMIDDGEMDWKVLAVRTDDPLAALVNDVADAKAPDAVKRAMDEVRHWFRIYKTLEGKGENSFAFDGKWLDQATTIDIIKSTHKQWKGIIDKRTGTRESLLRDFSSNAPF
jgi:inorganic pyrophosphatase